ncbi:HutD/Ves family protein [Pseudomonas sp.]|uniref:HutD/Ves family protein n=1 Tax=Pseudomonas sp. TaxID=306 RepID=UPI0040547F56
MSIRIIDSSTARQLPWKNGKGVTLELAIAPPDAGLDDFDWRISSARVESAGPFSHYPGIDRSLGLLSGTGLRLNLPEQISLELDSQTPVVAFPGELDVQAELLDGPVQDFNLMSRRNRWQHRLEYRELQGQQWLDSSAVLFIYCYSGAGLTCASADTAPVSLNAGQGLLVQDEAGPWRLTSQGRSDLYLARLEPASAGQAAIDLLSNNWV